MVNHHYSEKNEKDEKKDRKKKIAGKMNKQPK